MCATNVSALVGSTDALTFASSSAGHWARSGASMLATRAMLSATAWCNGQSDSSSPSPPYSAANAGDLRSVQLRPAM